MTRDETIDQKLARLQPMFFDPNVDPIVTNKTPGAGKDILQASANNLYSGVSMADLKGFNEKYGLNSRLVKQNGKLVEEVYRIDGKLRQVHHRDRQAPRGREAVCRTADGEGARRARQVLSHRRSRRSRGVRHRVGAGQGVAGRHHQRLHRGLRRSARHQGQLGRPGLLRQPGKDAAHQDARHQRAVVRGPHAVGCEVSQGQRAGHRRQRHRRRRRDRRLRPGDAGRHQPAERSGDPREVRQQVGGAVERQRGVRQVGARQHAQRVLVGRGRSRARRRSSGPSAAS